MPGFLPILLFIPLAVVSVGAIVFAKVNPNFFPTSTPRATIIPSPTPSPPPSPSPSPSPTPSQTPKPPPSPSPQLNSPVPAQTTSNSSSVGNATVLTYDLSSTTVVTDTANDSDCADNCPTKSLAQFVAENGGRAGMNGTYFCPPDYASCAGKVSSFDFPVWNNRNKKWINPSTLFWDGRGMMVFRSGSAQFFSCAKCVGAPSDITGGIVNYPALLSGSNILVGNDGTRGTRSGIGFGSGKLFLVVARNANFYDLANTFKSLGATDALNLDGGGSVALYDGGYRAGPGRSLPNAVIIK